MMLVGLGAVLWPAARRPRWLSIEVPTAAPALASALYTVDLVRVGAGDVFVGPGEVAILLYLLFVAVRHCPPRWAIVCGALDALALLATPGRLSRSDDSLVYLVVGLVLVGWTAGLAGYLRFLDYRRSVTISETRREERVAIAADMKLRTPMARTLPSASSFSSAR